MNPAQPNPSVAAALNATPESDAKLREQERSKGHAAAKAGLPASACPWNEGLTRQWWLEGHGHPAGMAPAQAF